MSNSVTAQWLHEVFVKFGLPERIVTDNVPIRN